MFTEQTLRHYPKLVKALTGMETDDFWAMMETGLWPFLLHRSKALVARKDVPACAHWWLCRHPPLNGFHHKGA